MHPRGLTLLLLGSWLFFAPFAFGNLGAPEAWNDLTLGALVCLIAWDNIFKPRPWKEWILCFIGVWLQFAPLIFWTRSAAVYSNDTFIGAFLILLSVALRGGPSSLRQSIPDGWSYNPSTWPHRTPIIALGILTFFVARLMSSYQLEHVPRVWDPFFGEGTRQVLTSNVAKAFPISDAGLGAASYLLEALAGMIGDVRRWRTMPWMVYLFFVLVVPSGVVSVVLIMLQPVVVGAWCTLCLTTATLTLLTLPPAIDEVFAATQFLISQRQRGYSLWSTFWTGDRSEHPGDTDSPPLSHSAFAYLREAIDGIDFTWNLSLCLIAGLWVVLMPGYFKLEHIAASVCYVAGACAVTVTILATAEPTRSLRFLNMPLGLVLIVSAWPMGLHGWAALSQAIVGFCLIGFSFRRGHLKERYGIFQRYIV